MSSSPLRMSVVGRIGQLVAGGTFTTAGGVATNHVARWDGMGWSPLDSGTDATVLALHSFGGDLVAGGSFTTAGGGAANHVARWNATTWSAISLGMNAWVACFAEFDGGLVAGGSVHGLGIYRERPYFAFVNGAVEYWDAASLPVHPALGLDGHVSTFCTFSGTVAIGGDLLWPWRTGLFAGDHWVGLTAGNWSPNPHVLEEVDNELLAGTSQGVWSWDGTTWTSLDGPYPNFHSHAWIEWNGQLVTGGTPDPLDANRSAVRVLVNGTWQALGPNPPDGTVYALEIHQGQLIAGGDFTNAGGAVVNEIARFDGAMWGPLGSGFVDPAPYGNAKVRALAVHDGLLVAGGSLPQSGGMVTTGIARWTHRVEWRGLGPDLRPVGSGVYFLRVEHAGESRTEKAVLLK